MEENEGSSTEIVAETQAPPKRIKVACKECRKNKRKVFARSPRPWLVTRLTNCLRVSVTDRNQRAVCVIKVVEYASIRWNYGAASERFASLLYLG